MINKELKILFGEYTSISELTEQEQQLAHQAIVAMQNAYAPYSGYHVGAALLLNNNTIVSGSNQENAAYPSGLCAERVALFYANSQYPKNNIVIMVVAAGKNGELSELPVTPCGSCRQVMLESEKRQNVAYKVILIGKNKILAIEQARYFLPFEFDGSALE